MGAGMSWAAAWGASWGTSWSMEPLALPGIARLYVHSRTFILRMTGVTWGPL